jgi:hypothetical protein
MARPYRSLPPVPVWGANVTVPAAGNVDWGPMLAGFDGTADYWNTWVLPQIHRVGLAGMNTVRLILGIDVVANGAMAAAAFIANAERVAVAAADRGMYATFSLVDPIAGRAFKYEGNLPFIGDLFGTLARHDNVDFCDLINEASAGIPDGVYTRQTLDAAISQVVAEVRAAAPSLCCGMSGYGYPFGDGSIINHLAEIDFFAPHVYSSNYGPDQIAALYANADAAGKKFVIEEFGLAKSSTAAAQTSYIDGIRTGPAADARCAGSLAWAAADQSSDPSNQWGFWSNDGTPYAPLFTPFGSFPHALARFPRPRRRRRAS